MTKKEVMKAFKGLKKLLDKRARKHIDWLNEEMTSVILSNTKDTEEILSVLPSGLILRSQGQDHLAISREDGRVFSFEQLEALGF